MSPWPSATNRKIKRAISFDGRNLTFLPKILKISVEYQKTLNSCEGHVSSGSTNTM
jgi:hypothetical protein